MSQDFYNSEIKQCSTHSGQNYCIRQIQSDGDEAGMCALHA